MALSYSYCYSDTVYGVTNNAAGAGLTWGMNSVLPDTSAPNVSLQVNGLLYQYTMNKNPEDDAQVHVRNEDAIRGGYVFEETDDWSGLPGSSIRKFFRFEGIDSSRWGDGEIAVEGDGVVTDPTVTYSYRMDIGEEALNCMNPLTSPDCPNYLDSLRDYLANLDTDPSADDPFYDEWVQAQLEQEVELEEEEQVDEEEQEEEEDNLEGRLSVEPSVGGLVDAGTQADIMAQLAGTPEINSYYVVTIPGGEYQETVKLEDTTLPDNRRALRSLARDESHRAMVRSQYDREQ